MLLPLLVYVIIHINLIWRSAILIQKNKFFVWFHKWMIHNYKNLVAIAIDSVTVHSMFVSSKNIINLFIVSYSLKSWVSLFFLLYQLFSLWIKWKRKEHKKGKRNKKRIFKRFPWEILWELCSCLMLPIEILFDITNEIKSFFVSG